MSPEEIISGAEDLEVDGSEAESVAGGMSVSRFERMQDAEAEIFRLANQGYVECSCIEGGTVMEDPKSGHRIAVKFR
jgi:hypothetical protein